MKAIFYQSELSYSFEFNGVRENELSKLVGTACNRFFQFAMVCKKNGVKSFKFSEPVFLVVENETVIFDSQDIEEFKLGLKLQRNKEGLKRFANKTLDVVNFALSEIEIKTVEEL